MANPIRLGALACALLLALAPVSMAAEATTFIGPVVLDTGVTTNGQIPVSASNPLPVTATVTGTSDVNLKQVNGATVGTGHGTASGALRVELPTDGTGVVGLAAGTTTAVTNVGTFATQSTLQAGTAIAGKFGIDQTTPGTTNGVQVNAALPAGTSLIGKVGIDQTTPGTTNKVSIGTDGTVAATQSGTWNVTNVSGTVSLPTGASTAANQTATQSPVTAATATATTSALAGCRYVSTLDTFTTSQQGAVNCGTRGSLSIQLMRPDSANAVSSSSAAADGASNAQAAYFIYDLLHVFNGSTWDRAFTCANTASVNVTAGNTTQIVGLSGSTVIRVCSVSISMSAAGTVAFVTGTGTNCGTPTTIMTAMNLGTATPWAQTAPEGGSLFRSTTGGEICVTAVTGNVTGLITYAQY